MIYDLAQPHYNLRRSFQASLQTQSATSSSLSLRGLRSSGASL